MLSSLCSIAILLFSTQVYAQVSWNFVTKNFSNMERNYTPFFIDGSGISFYGGGNNAPSGHAGNGIARFSGSLSSVSSFRTVISTGPDPIELNYFRGVSSGRAKIPNSTHYEHWMAAEVSRCYSANECDITNRIIRMAVYRSVNSGANWQFQGLMKVNGKFHTQWGAHTGLIFNPGKPAVVDLVNPKNNRFIMYGNKTSILVSADGVNYQRVAIQWPASISNDSPVFVGLEQTPHGFHMMAGANWGPNGTETIRHLFSKDLINWKVLESQSVMKNRNYYKGVILRYEPATNRLWAFSGCGSKKSCGYLAWITPKDFAATTTSPTSPSPTPTTNISSGTGSINDGTASLQLK